MIKPVYFGKSKEDKLLIDYVNKLSNFSEWVKDKIREELGLNQTEIVGINIDSVDNIKDKENIKDIEMLIRKIVLETIRGEEKVDIEKMKNIDNQEIEIIEVIKQEDEINISSWTM